MTAPDPPVTPARSANMAKVRGKNTKPEMAVRRAAHALGLRFRLHRRDLPGTPDLVFPGRRTAIFVHGCFWHRHRGCRRATTPKSNTAFWLDKFAANRRRDAAAIRELRRRGFRVVVVWECGLQRAEARLSKILEARGVDVRRTVDH